MVLKVESWKRENLQSEVMILFNSMKLQCVSLILWIIINYFQNGPLVDGYNFNGTVDSYRNYRVIDPEYRCLTASCTTKS